MPLQGHTTWFLRKAAASSLERRLVCRFVRSVVARWLATPRTPPLWQRDFFLVNSFVLRSLLASERSGVVKTFRCRDEIMSRKWIAILSVAALVAILASPILVGLWEHRSLASAKTFTDTCALLGEPVESFDSVSGIEDRFGNWDFHDIATNDITFTPDLPPVTDRVGFFRGRLGMLTEYVVYFDGDEVTHAYFVGAN